MKEARQAAWCGLLGVAMALALAVCLLPMFSQRAHASSWDGNLEYEVVGGEAAVVGASSNLSGRVVVPETLGGYTVTSIRGTSGATDGNTVYYSAFRASSEKITEIVLPDTIKTIDDCAFSVLRNLKTINIPSSVTKIGRHAFFRCSSLQRATIPRGVEKIEYQSFSFCSKLGQVDIPDTVTELENYAFYGCSSLASVVIPDSITKINDYAFNECGSLSSVSLPANLTAIGNYAFRNCSQLAHIAFPGSLEKIGGFAFVNCGSLKTLVIPSSVNDMGTSAFYGCSGLENLVLSDGVTSIGVDAFSKCTSLKSVSIPESVTEIKGGAFISCSSLSAVSLPASLAIVGENVFGDCESLRRVYYAGDESQWEAISFGARNESFINTPLYTGIVGIPEEVVGVPETCGRPGTKPYFILDGKYYEDEACRAEIRDIDTWKVIPATGRHTAEVIPAVPATTERTGLTEGKRCSVCGLILEAQRVTDKIVHTLVTTTKPATTTSNGSITTSCTDCGEVTEVTPIPKIATAKLAKAVFAYDKRAKKPTVVAKDASGKTLKKGVDYKLSTPKSAKNIGAYSCTVTFMGDYKGTVKLPFTIGPKNVKSFKLAATKKGFAASWTVQKAKMPKTRIAGYQIRYSTKASMKSAKTVKVKGYKASAQKVGKLKAKKKYYVQMCTYIKVGGKTYCSPWSKTKTVKTR